ncbi:di-trans,poly-cis-decaprenylcistransferase [Candidatus Woesearchaeota archaeon CG10_big_fil_rev_8_21_14_0_10_34_12]|nr:MAG: di-trans,poly-cis-decaprenylcistransferase [Candidatus Woesearchaeota archaeon CG10_big_fil_rev_8_21_14_0_10_34_12]
MAEELKVNHLGVVVDGNRRWAKERNLKPWNGHEEGAEVIEKLLDWAKELGIKELTLYVLSTENLKRDRIELEFLFKLFKKFFSKFKKDKRIKENKVKIRFIGDLSSVPSDVAELARETEEDTKEHNSLIINFCFAYGGRLELTTTINKILKSGKKEVSEEDIEKSLWLKESPDLIIRTGGAVRTSNFLPWQSAYSEWIFMDKFWPDFTKQDLGDCLKEFKNRKRNFGK